MDRMEIFNAASAALWDWWAERGGAYKGPAASIYIAITDALVKAEKKKGGAQ